MLYLQPYVVPSNLRGLGSRVKQQHHHQVDLNITVSLFYSEFVIITKTCLNLHSYRTSKS